MNSENKKKETRFISNYPNGIDLFEGKSQEKVAESIRKHIIKTDIDKDSSISRIIGLEGKWGSGKSNIIKMLEKSMNTTTEEDTHVKKYHFFTYDAWGNQEDLQRRSILELLTKDLIINHELKGNPEITVLNPKDGSILTNKKCTWEEKLQTLLSRKSYTREITVPSINESTKFFVLTLFATGLFISFADAYIKNASILIGIIVTLIPFFVFIIYMIFGKKKWKEMFAMYETGGESDTTSYIINEQEPSVREFKDWMDEISKSLNADLIMVFDNMDRLPSNKVHQLWSSIHTFFADGGYNNIWCIIPYDKEHLAKAFEENEQLKEKRNSLLQHFIDKTFPITYRVPEPVLTDYKEILNHFLKEAFDNETDEMLDKINRCYRLKYDNPNVREMITFTNKMVSLRQTWDDNINLISIAIYLIQEKEILEPKEISTERTITTETYMNEFSQIFTEKEKKDIQQDISALVYGIEPKHAYQIVLKQDIKSGIKEENDFDLNKYKSSTHFLSILEEVIYELDPFYNEAILPLAKIDDEDKNNTLSQIWNFIGNRYKENESKIKEYTDIESCLFLHVNSSMQKDCAKSFCKRLFKSKEIQGKNLFIQLEKLFSESFTKEWDIKEICPPYEIEAEKFMEYVKEGEKEYDKYPIHTDVEKLKEFIKTRMTGDFPYIEELNSLKKDSKYSLQTIGDYAEEVLKKENTDAKTTEILIHIQRIFFDKFRNGNISQNYMTSLWNETSQKGEESFFDEIVTLVAFLKKPPIQINMAENKISVLIEKSSFYSSTIDLIKLTHENPTITYLKEVVTGLIKQKKHDNNPDFENFVSIWEDLNQQLSLSLKEIAYFADDWKYTLSKKEKGQSIQSLFSKGTWANELKDCNTQLVNELKQKGAAELIEQNKSVFIQNENNIPTNSYWYILLQYLITTDFITQDNIGKLKDVAASLLDYIAKTGPINNDTWNSYS